MKNTLTIVRGIPGSGKSTFCRTRYPNIFHIENDMFHYHNNDYVFSYHKQKDAIEWCTDMVTLALKKGMDCVVSNTFTRRDFVDSYVKIGQAFGANVEVFRMMGDFDNIHSVPEDVYNNMKNGFEDYNGEKFVYPTENGYKIGEKQ
jgi:adenylate kinase family enzyme